MIKWRINKLFSGPKKSEKNDASRLFHANQTLKYKTDRQACFLNDAFKNNVLRQAKEATIMKIEQNLRNKRYIVTGMHCDFVLKFNTNLRKSSLKCQI